MAINVSIVVLDRPYLDAKIYGGSGILLTGDDGDNISFSVGSRAYAHEVVTALNEIAERHRDPRKEHALKLVQGDILFARLRRSLEMETPSMAAE